MYEINRYLEKIKEKPMAYLGCKDLVALSFSISGYETAIFDITGKRVLFNTKFQRFIEFKYRIESKNTVHWSKILMANTSNTEVFDLFFELWDEFSRLYPNWEELDYTLIAYQDFNSK